MLNSLSLRFRLNLMIALTLAIIVGVGALFVIHDARRSVSEEVRSSLDSALQLVEFGIDRMGGDREALIAWLETLARAEKISYLRIQLSQPPQTLIKFAQAPQTRKGPPAPDWFAWLSTPRLKAGEKQVEARDGSTARIFIEADPADEIAEAWVEARSFLILMLALAGAVAGLVHVTLGRAFKSVGLILQGMENIEHGDYEKRLPRFELPEFDRISSTFNHMALSLARARNENRDLTRHSLRVQEDERRYLAQEVHDEFGQSLSAIKLMAASLRNGSGSGAEAEALRAIMAQCDRLFGVARTMMRRLRPLMLDELGLIPSLLDMVENWRARHPEVDIRLDLDDKVEDAVDAAKIHLFRIVQECLTNIAKHAGAHAVRICLQMAGEERIRLAIGDDGRGFAPGEGGMGFGLRGIAERVASMDGSWSLDAAPGRGVSLEILIPCEKPSP